MASGKKVKKPTTTAAAKSVVNDKVTPITAAAALTPNYEEDKNTAATKPATPSPAPIKAEKAEAKNAPATTASKTASTTQTAAKSTTPAKTATPASAVKSTTPAKATTKTAAAKAKPKKVAPKKTATKKATTSTTKKAAAKPTIKKAAAPAKKTTNTAAKKAATTPKTKSKATIKPTAAKKPSSTTQQSKDKTMATAAKKTTKAYNTTAQAQDHILQFSREGAEQIAKTTDVASKAFNDAVAQSKETVQACVESGKIAGDMTRSMISESFRFANESFSDNVEISKEMFNCRTVNDMLDIQNKLMRSNMDHFFNQSVRMSEMMFQFMSDASEPLNESAARATNRMAKAAF